MEKKARGHFRHLLTFAVILTCGTGLFFLYVWLYTDVLGWDLPKTALLRQENAQWTSRMENLQYRLHQSGEVLEALRLREETIYRPIFDVNAVDSRFEYWLPAPLEERIASFERQVAQQAGSIEELEMIARAAGDFASCVPAIPPITPDPKTYNMSSPFGYRVDPLNGTRKMHTGMDFACRPGNPIFATGDGVVENVTFDNRGYGISIMIDHGFGYKTRYAHLSLPSVAEGMSVRRGDQIGLSGKSGRVSGPHLHYEVYFRGQAVNPYYYMDLKMDLGEYKKLIESRQEDAQAVLGTPKLR